MSLSWIADFLGERSPIGIALAETPHEIGERAGHQKILLHKSQALPHARGIVRIEHPRQRFGLERLRHRADEITVAELLKIEVIRRRRGPQAERVDGLAAVAHHGTIEGNADQAGRLVQESRCKAAAAHLERAVQLDLDLLTAGGRPPTGPGGAASCPAARAASRLWIDLFEHAVFVAQAVAHRGKLHRGHRIQEAGRQPAEPAVAQAGVGLLFEQSEPVDVLCLRTALFTTGSSRRFVTLLASERPMRNSIER